MARGVELVRDRLQRFAAAPEPACGSDDLLWVAYRGAEAAAEAASRGDDLDDNALAAGLLLDVADAAADRGCADIARPIYRRVISVYTGWGYAAYRQRAEIGLADLRAAGR